ncbi:hypothetical protein AX16_003231 [Volvariella volvacea WC 439]|nr:hypothetical protein AX16_003231 [Volvariella volvacea WC 439]
MMNLLNTDDQTYRLLLGIWLAVLAAGNIMIAGSLTHSLTRCDPHFLPDNTPFARVLRGFLQTGLVIALFSIITLVCFFSSPSTNVIGLLALPFGRLYSNAVLDTLLSRIPYSARSTNAEILITKSGTDSIWLPTGSTGTGRGAGGLNSGGGAGGAGTNSNNNFHLRSIHVKTEVYSDANNDQDGPASDEDESKSGRRGMGI